MTGIVDDETAQRPPLLRLFEALDMSALELPDGMAEEVEPKEPVYWRAPIALLTAARHLK